MVRSFIDAGEDINGNLRHLIILIKCELLGQKIVTLNNYRNALLRSAYTSLLTFSQPLRQHFPIKIIPLKTKNGPSLESGCII
jgi:hypothetical protein